VKQTEVLERVYDPGRLLVAWQQVKRNAGAAGIDQMTVAAFEARKEELLALIHEKLKAMSYRFKPARRALIPKEGSTAEKRKLGIPVVMDRVVAQSMHQVFEEIFDSEFTGSNFGYRRGKSQHQAILYLQSLVRAGYMWCASIDLASFFDKIPHDLILRLIRRRIADERVVTLVARVLKAGVMVEGKFEKTQEGCPQGSPLSPILSNIVLNEFDQELERRGHKYCRWADDFVIVVRSERAAHRVMGGGIRYLEALGLEVNREKSRVARIREVAFLGFQIVQRKIRVSAKAWKRFKDRVRALTRRNNPLSMYEVIVQLNIYLRGWVEYFRVQESRTLFRDLDRWIRSRLRSMQLKKWKKARKFQRVMMRAGHMLEQARQVWIKMKRWRSVNRKEVRFVLNLQWFRRLGLLFLYDFTRATPGHRSGS
jgi:RNA-directed DNA polymerase